MGDLALEFYGAMEGGGGGGTSIRNFELQNAIRGRMTEL